MSKTHLVFGDAHAHPDYSNERADYLGKLINDLRPDVVIDIGDTADMLSLNSYDKGVKAYVGRSYAADIDAHNEFQDKVWHYIRRSKRKLPRRVRLIGNHEHRISRALNLQPELAGTIGLEDLQLSKYYDTIVEYDGSTPGIIDIDGIAYAHYFISGVLGRPVSGEHQAHALLNKNYISSTQGHSHVFDYAHRFTKHGRSIQTLISGCYQDYHTDWAGQGNNLWWRGCFIKHNVDDGRYDLEAVSMNRLKEKYGLR
jgi:hypothetical protein